MDLKQLSEALALYIRPVTFPLALKMLSTSQEIPPKARIPRRDLNTEVTLCQAIAMGRRYGWTMALGAEDHCCPFGALALGQMPAKPYFLDGTYWEEGMMAATRDAARESSRSMKRLEYGKYSHVLLAPLDRADFTPDLVLIYGNSAQVMRLVQAATHGKGGVLVSSSSGGRDCADMITAPLLSGECQFVLPGGGDRVFGLTQDDEMAFSIPIDKAAMIVDGLQATHKMGWRYPIPSFLRFTPEQPRALRRLMEVLRQAD